MAEDEVEVPITPIRLVVDDPNGDADNNINAIR